MMRRPARWTIGVGLVCGVVGGVSLLLSVLSCGTAPTAFLVRGPGQLGNEPPTLEIKEPITNQTRGQGDPFLIRWTDSDRDSAAQIRFSLVNIANNATIILVDGLDENDEQLDTHTVGTSLIPHGSYNLLGTITDEQQAVDVFAMTTGASAQRVIITIVPEGGGPQTEPPQITVVEPVVNLSMAQDDDLTIVVQPTPIAPLANDPNPIPFDPDSELTLFVMLDVDLNPNNDDPANPDPTQIILLQPPLTVAAGNFQPIPFTIPIDLATSPPLPAGAPYFIRVTADDGTNPRVHRYAVGTINIVQLASGSVDLADVGRSVSGARFYGFNPGANLGSDVTGDADFDEDGISDFVVVAQFGNPQNVGPVGEAYLVYGRDRVRFGGAISANTVSQTVSGVVFQAPPARDFVPSLSARTDGITDVDFVRDLSGDGRPEILFGLSHVRGAFDSDDYDPDDQNPTDIDFIGCFADPFANNFTNQVPERDVSFYYGGMAVIVNSQNRDSEGVGINVNRLESTSISLELVGQLPRVLDAGGTNDSGNIIPRADNNPPGGLGTELGNDPEEDARIAGARFTTGPYDCGPIFFPDPDLDQAFCLIQEPPKEDLYGHRVGSLGDLNSDGLDELIISAPHNERYLADLAKRVPFPEFYPQYASTLFRSSIVILPGTNYNDVFWRDLNDEDGTCVIPSFDQQHFPPFGGCSATLIAPRDLFRPAETSAILAENIDDFLGDGQSAGDFNQDGLDDILCAAPLNDRTSSLRDSGAVYILYGRTIFGDIDLGNANDPILRPPMIRIRGVSLGDHIGAVQTAGRDVNGDRVDDLFIASATTDFGGVQRGTCAGDFNRDGNINQSDLREVAFVDCRLDFPDEVFTSDACKAFDYDNDGDLDDDDECVFCCLSDDCEPDESCVFGKGTGCCENLVDNGFVAVVFGGRFTDGDRTINQVGTSDLPGTIFYGGKAGDRAGADVSSAGDFNHDGFGDLLITAPGEIRRDAAGRQRVGVVYLVFGGTHLTNATWNLSDPESGVGSAQLPGLVFLSPYVMGRPNEAAPTTVGLIGDINSDGFDDILIGNPKADFIDLSFPQGPDAPGSDAAAGRRRNAGDAYIVYGNNFGTNRVNP